MPFAKIADEHDRSQLASSSLARTTRLFGTASVSKDAAPSPYGSKSIVRKKRLWDHFVGSFIALHSLEFGYYAWEIKPF